MYRVFPLDDRGLREGHLVGVETGSDMFKMAASQRRALAPVLLLWFSKRE